MLVGRDRERARIRRAVAEATDGRSSVLAVVGGDGLGKSALLAEAAGAGLRHLAVTGVEAERALPFAGLHQVVQRAPDLVAGLPAPQQAAVEGALGLRPAEPSDRFTIGVAVLGMLAVHAAEGPLLVTVDDAHWLDDATLEALAFACRRLGAEGIAVLLASEPGPAVDDHLRGVEVLVLAPLGEDDARALLAARHPAVTPAVAARLVRSCRGNPLDLLQVASMLDHEQLAGRRPLPDALPAGRRLADAVAAQLDGLADAARRALTVVAASGRASTKTVAAACQAIGASIHDLEEPEQRGMVELGGGVVAFRHPLARSAVYRAAPAPLRREAHRALAQAGDDARDVERRAWHLAAAAVEADEEVAAALEAAGDEATRRGAGAAAADAYERAAGLSVEPAARTRRLVAAADSAALAGRADDVLRLLDLALPGVGPDEAPGIQVRRARALALRGPLHEARDLLVGCAEAASDDGAADLLVQASLLALQERDATAALELARRARGEARSAAPTTRAVVAEGAALALAGRPDDARPLLAAWPDLGGATSLASAELLVQAVALPLTWVEEFEEAVAVLDEVERAARSMSAPALLPRALVVRSLLDYRTNRWRRAVAAAAEAAELAEETGQQAVLAMALAAQSSAEASLGREGDCRAHAARALALLGEAPGGLVRIGVMSALGSLELGLGRPVAALAVYDVGLHLWDLEPPGNPGAILYEADRIEALVDAGRRPDAIEALAALEARVDGDGDGRAATALHRCRGILAGEGEADRSFDAAVTYAQRSGSTYSEGRAELRWGERLLAAGRPDEARDHLRAALHLLDRVGASLWSARAARTLGALGDRTPQARPDLELTAAEMRAASALAERGDPSAAASSLFLTEATVRRQVADALAHSGAGDVGELHRRVAGGPTVELLMLGGFVVRRDGADATPTGHAATTVKLVVAAGGRLHVEELIDGIWPGADPALGRRRLRNVLNRVRTSAGDLLRRSGDLVALDDAVDVDVFRFEQAAARAIALAAADRPAAVAAARAALAVYGGDLSPESIYEPWAAGLRERLRRRHLAVLDLVAHDAADRGDTGEAVDLLERAIAADPLDEERYAAAAEVLLAIGRRAAARGYVERALRSLAEIGLAPSDRLVALVERLRRGD